MKPDLHLHEMSGSEMQMDLDLSQTEHETLRIQW